MPPRSLTVLRVLSTATVLLVVTVISGASDQVFIDTAQVKIFGANQESHLGASSSGAGDVDGDGISDIVVGAPGADNRSHNTGGNAYIIRGSADVDTEIDLKFPPSDSVVVLEGATPGDQLGFSVSNAGDVNGDGIDDFIVGAPGAVSTDPIHHEPDTGRAYIIYGSPNLPPTIDVSSLGSAGITMIGGQEDGRFGSAVSGAGDFNGDGYGDVLVGAPNEEHNQNGDAGAAYLILGGPSLSSWMDFSTAQSGVAVFKTGGHDNRVGSSVADLEDFNGDGHTDIAIASLRFGDAANPAAGRAWIIFGGSTPSAEINLNELSDSGLSGVTIRTPVANDEVGQSISCAGDADADGDTEVLVTRSLDDHDPETIATVAYLIRGSSDPDEEINLAESHPMVTRYDTFFDNEEEGQSAHGTYDVTGDGVDDHIVGIPRSVLLEVEKGIAHRVDGDQNLGGSQLLDLLQHSGRGFIGLGQDQKVGYSVGAAGNFNDDRGNDMMIGAPGTKPYGRSEAGALYVFLGHSLRSPNQVQTEALGQTVSVSWNNRAVYDQVDLFRDGSHHATLPGDAESFTDENVAEGNHTYKVNGTRRTVTSVKKSSSIRVLDPADMLQCVSHQRQVTFTWMNQDTEYEAIDVYRDGTVIATLAGTAEMFIDADVSFGNHEYQLVERGDRTTTLPSSCSIIVLQPPYLAFCSAAPDPVTNENVAQLDWSNGPDTLYEEILIYRDGSLLQTLAGNAVSTTDIIDPGRYVYEIEALADGGRATSARASCEVTDPIAPENLVCSADVHNVTFTWNNTDAYDQIIIEFGPADGSSPPVQIALIPGGMEIYQTVVTEAGDYTVCVRGEKFNGQSGRTCCTLSVPFPLGATSCSSQGTTVSLSWSNGGDYDTIAVRRDGLLIDTISGGLETYTDEQVPYGDHEYSLRAKLRLGVTAPQSCGLRVLASPENMTCRGEADQVRITWDNPATAYTNIEVRRGDDLIETLSGDDTEYVDTGRSPGEYSYSLAGTHGSSRSDSSDCETVIPEPVNTLGTNLLEGTNALLTWAPTDTDVESVEIFRDGSAIAIVPATSTSYIDPNLAPGTYNYCVRSRIGDNYSTDICKDAIVPIPPNSIACSVDSAIATIMWGNGEVYDTVILKRDGGTIVEFLDGSVTSYVDSNPGPGLHMYTVSGRIGDFVSTDLSCVVTVPYPPADLACSVSGGVDSVLTWVNTEPSTSIRVYRDGSLIDELDPASAGYTDAGVAPATYEYCVVNVFAHGDGEKTSASTCCTLIVPAPPSDFSCLSVSGDVELAWTNNDAYEDLTLLKDGDVIAVLAGTDSSYTDSAAGPGSHTYTLSGSIEGNSSATVSCTEDVPAAINNPIATALASTVSLTWNHNGPGDEVDLTRDGVPLTTLPISQTSHEDAGLSPAVYEYCWTVRIGDGTSPTICRTARVLADPTDFNCAAVSGEVDITWTNNDIYGQFTLNRDGQLLALLPGDVSSFHDASAGAGLHTYDLTARRGPRSTSSTVDCSVDVPSTPVDMACSALGSTVSLSWTLPAPGDAVELSRNGSVIATLAGDATSFDDTGVAAGNYDYCVVNTIGSGTSATTCCSARVIAAPSGFSCLSVSGDVELGWTNDDEYDTLTLTRDGALLAILPGDTSSFTDAAQPHGSHTYELYAELGELSTSATASCTEVVPSTPQNLSCSLSGGTQVNMSWDLPATGSSIDLFQNGKLIGSLGGASTSNTETPGPGTYEYCLIVRIGDGTGPTVCCDIVVPEPLSGIACSTFGDGNDLSWTNGETYDMVQIYRDGTLAGIVDGDQESHTDFPLGPGTYDYEVVATLAGSQTAPIACSVTILAPPVNLACTFFGAPIHLDWENSASYDTIHIERNGVLISSISGNATSQINVVPVEGTYSYRIWGEHSDGITTSTSCSGSVKSFLRGDANSDTNCDIADGIWVLNWLFVGGPEPTCFDSADFDDNGIVTIGDAMLMIFYYLSAAGTPTVPPSAPFPDPGLDTTDDVLDCIDSPY